MAIAYNPRIVTSGLVLCLDAGNVKSYPGSGTAWTDLSGNGNNGNLVNGVGYNNSNLGSLVFDGANDYVITSTVSNYKSLSMWVYLDSKSSYLLDARTGSPSGYFWFPGGDANFGPDWDDFYVNGNSVSRSLSNIPTAQWFNFYIKNSASRTGTINLFSRYTNNEQQAGKYSMFLAYNRDLTAQEIQQNFNATRGRFGL